MRYYIAYGSNLNTPQMAQRCPKAAVVATGELKDYCLEFRCRERYGVATIRQEKGSSVPILLWSIKPSDERSLDYYEGHPFFYHKEMMAVEINGKMQEAMVYVMNDGHDLTSPSDYYLNIIREGYREFGFDEKILDEAVAHAQEQAMADAKMDLEL